MPKFFHTPKTKKITVAVIAALAAVATAIGLFLASEKQQVSTDEPVDIVSDLYGRWLEAAKSTSTNPYQEELNKSPLLGKELRGRLAPPHSGLDPVLCQTVPPEKFSTRRIYEGADKVEILVTAKKPSASTEQAIVTLLPLDGGWYIEGIQCSPGEFAPEMEFSFDREGQLAKIAAGSWRLVFEEDGQPGHEAPLLFGAQSMCRALDGNTAVCNPAAFVENARAHVRGQMTESGIEVALVALAG